MKSGSAITALQQLEGAYGVNLTAGQGEALLDYVELLRRWNRRVSLTALKGTIELMRAHFFESFWAADRFLGEGTSIADVGAGGGFPGLAMKLYRNDLRVTLIEKNSKKVVFLKEVSRALPVAAEVFEGQAEQFSGWESIQVVTLRALKPSEELLRILSSRRLQLLCFHGKKLSGGLCDLPILEQSRAPGTLNRHVTLLQC